MSARGSQATRPRAPVGGEAVDAEEEAAHEEPSASAAPAGAAAASSAASSAAAAATGDSVKLISADGAQFTVARATCLASGFLRSLLTSGRWAESARGEVAFPSISTRALEKAIEYMAYKSAHSGGGGGLSPLAPLPPFHIPVEDALELLAAANYLDL